MAANGDSSEGKEKKKDDSITPPMKPPNALSEGYVGSQPTVAAAVMPTLASQNATTSLSSESVRAAIAKSTEGLVYFKPSALAL
ncbi:hypothetical protein [Frigoribacterium sp. UYMn621]|uniref:hypothetical protein n=1 Tax=Frigoribacterium sp. UYMn621 TaxID=3156343 RepID=UPI0033982A72